nr:hypothetical protein B0A51_01000 [Rachicladosporium sp. CCFEE 5018]
MCWSCTHSPPTAPSTPSASPGRYDDRRMEDEADASERSWDLVNGCITKLGSAAQMSCNKDIVELTTDLSERIDDTKHKSEAAARQSYCDKCNQWEAHDTIKRLREEAREDECVVMDLRRAIHESEINEEGALEDLETQTKAMKEAMDLAGVGSETLQEELMLRQEQIREMEAKIHDMKLDGKTIAAAHAEELSDKDREIAALQRSVKYRERQYPCYAELDLEKKLGETEDEVFRLTNENRRLQALQTDAEMMDDAAGTAERHTDTPPLNDTVTGSGYIDTPATDTCVAGASILLPLRSRKRSPPCDDADLVGNSMHEHRLKRMRAAGDETKRRDDTIADLRDTLAERERLIGEVQRENDALKEDEDGRIQEMEIKLRGAEETVKLAGERAAKLATDLTLAKDKIRRREKGICEAAAETEEMRSDRNAVFEDLEEKAADYERLSADNEKLQERISQQHEELYTLNNKVRRLDVHLWETRTEARKAARDVIFLLNSGVYPATAEQMKLVQGFWDWAEALAELANEDRDDARKESDAVDEVMADEEGGEGPDSASEASSIPRSSVTLASSADDSIVSTPVPLSVSLADRSGKRPSPNESDGPQDDAGGEERGRNRARAWDAQE